MNNANNEVLQIALADIIPNQFQPRMNFDEQELQELAQSIKEHGIIQPLVLRKMGAKYEIIAGERRYRAAGMAGLTTVPAIISNIDDQTSAEVALVENVQRKDLTAIEEARSYKNILDKGYLTQEQLAKKMGISQPAIANKLRLLNLDKTVQDALLNGKISERHARSLLALESHEKQRAWLDRIINQRLTVRQLDIAIKKSQDGSNNDGIPLVDINQEVNAIRDNAVDINSQNNSNSLFNINKPNDSTSNNPKPQNKFFNFLEDESANMNTTANNTDDIFNSVPNFIPSTSQNQEAEENKFINYDTLDLNPTDNTSEIEVLPEDSQQEEPKLETLFDPMDQVELLDPDYEEKQKAAAGLDLNNAINHIRTELENLTNKGFKIDSEESDLSNEYQIIIKIEK